MVARRLRKAGLQLLSTAPSRTSATLIEFVGLHRLPGVLVVPRPRPPDRTPGGPAAPLA